MLMLLSIEEIYSGTLELPHEQIYTTAHLMNKVISNCDFFGTPSDTKLQSTYQAANEPVIDCA